MAGWVGMSLIVGIDLGTTNSLVAVVEAGIPYVMADADGTALVGEPTRRIRGLCPETTFYSVKRFTGHRARVIAL